jgi:hypothetical protein
LKIEHHQGEVVRVTYNVTPDQVRDNGLSISVRAVLDGRTQRIVGNVIFPPGRTYKQRLACIRKRFGESALFAPTGEYEWIDEQSTPAPAPVDRFPVVQASGIAVDLFGRAVTLAATGNVQGVLFHEPVAVAGTDRETIRGSKNALDPRHTAKLFESSQPVAAGE